ncbi:hypothetical protein [Amycolatopsis suaedae]|uniref:Uncharacterized protein n=1 Tax=Amycolatopsis suaedae TaxID=2510978 RepID=A0A4Q7J9Y9_9PSEU|nr:hypothetical protein [Amycolatopsis suaedae]RZQ63722.1 hypothetical protein EWH70_11130 [Amycolatopsis suaedae]
MRRRSWTSLLPYLIALVVVGTPSAILIARYGDFSSSDAPPDTPCPPHGTGDAVPGSALAATAAPYAGPAPHPIAVYTVDYLATRSAIPLPPGWEPASGRPAQLVACQYPGTTGGPIGTSCSFTSGDGQVTLPMHHQTYRFRVYEAKTAEPVTELEVPGTSTTCPHQQWVTYRDGKPDPGSVVAGLDAERVVRALRPVVEATFST